MLTRIPVQTEPDPEISHSHPARSEFDVVVAQRPKYIPNSGPPLAPIGIMPAHDKDGIIEQMFTLDGTPQYIVSFEKQPWLKLAVKPENICKYVSARTLEDWEWKQTQLRTQLEEEHLDPKVKARLEKQRRKEMKATETETSSRGDEEDMKKRKPDRRAPKNKSAGDAGLAANRKLSASGMGAGIALSLMAASSPVGPGRRTQEAEEATHISPKRPTLLTPTKQQRGLADALESDSEDDEDVNATLERQLNGSPVPSPDKSMIHKQKSQSANNSTASPKSAKAQVSEKRRSRSNRSSFANSKLAKQDSHDKKRRKTTSDLEDSVASISSRTAFQVYEELESKAKNKNANYFKDRYSTLAKQQKKTSEIRPANIYGSDRRKTAPAVPPRLRESRSSSLEQSPLRRSERSSSRTSTRGQDSASKLRRSNRASSSASINYAIPPHLPLPPKNQSEEEGEDDEYDVEAILGEELRTVNGEEIKYYKIRWQGDWDDTWEPEENVGVSILKEWRKQQQAERKAKMKATAEEVGSGSEEDSLFVRKKPATSGKRKSPAKSITGNKIMSDI